MKREFNRRYLIFLIFLIFLIEFASSSIIIEKQPEKSYNIGKKIDVDISVKIDGNQNIVSSDLLCDNYKLNYFKTPLNQDSNENYFNIPPLVVNENFIGNCKIKFILLNTNGQVLEETSTNNFDVTNVLIFNFSTDKDTYFPGNKILIEGKLAKGVKLNISLRDEEKEIDSFTGILSNDVFSIIFDLADNVIKGEKNILVYGEDKYGNKGQNSKKIEVAQVARNIKIELEKNKILPNEELIINSGVYDQSGEAMDIESEYKIFDPGANLIDSIISRERKISFGFKNPSPGEYIIRASYKELEDTDKFSVLEVRKIRIDVENGIIHIKNIGNVKYIDDMTVNASVDGIIYQVPIILNLNIDEEAFIDLRTELPSKNYDLTVYSNKEAYKLGSIKTEDNRPLIKKLSQGLSKLTGSTIISTEKISNVFYLIFLLVFFGFVVTFFTYRRFKNKITNVVDTTIKIQGEKIGGLTSSLVRNEREKSKIKDMFGAYVDPNILDEKFISNIRKKEISVLFTDIRGFAKIFDKADSEKITKMLNMYFGKSSEIIKNNKGFINKFIGDSVMGLFNAVIDDKNHLLNCIKSALEIKKEMVIVNEKLKFIGLDPIEVGIGVDSGMCSVGSVGSENKMEYTAIGVPINVAFRLQSLSQGNVLITSRVYEKIKDKINAVYFDEIEMKNITGKVRIYKVLGSI